LRCSSKFDGVVFLTGISIEDYSSYEGDQFGSEYDDSEDDSGSDYDDEDDDEEMSDESFSDEDENSEAEVEER
jgi:hypothetical protein